MLRMWARAGLCVLATVACVAAQRGFNPNHPRIGLVADTLGVNPVGDKPGFNQPVHNSGLQECFCLPTNQQCPFDGGIIDINVRIVNQRPLVDGKCPEVTPNLCCPPGLSTTPDPFPSRPGSCGQRFNIPTSIRPTGAEAKFGEYPWTTVVLGNQNQFLGAGVLISSQFVLTAAHKVAGRPATSTLAVRLGDYDLQSPQDHESLFHIEVPITETIIHPDFNNDTLQNDVALLRMAYPINTSQFRHIGEACLPDQGQKFEGQRTCFVSGWGKDSFEASGRFQRIMKEVDLPIVEGFTCELRLRDTRLGENYKLDTNSFLCAGGISGKDACTGDGGAPLVCPTPRGYVVVGLVAWGIGCGTSNVPGVYVNVPNFINFIRRYV